MGRGNCEALHTLPPAWQNTRPLKFDLVIALRSLSDIAKATFAGARTAIPRHRRSRYSGR
jgi:hypothetical protein